MKLFLLTFLTMTCLAFEPVELQSLKYSPDFEADLAAMIDKETDPEHLVILGEVKRIYESGSILDVMIYIDALKEAKMFKEVKI